MIGEVRPIMIIHVCLAFKEGAAGVMTAFHCFDSVSLGRVSNEVFVMRTLKRTTLLKAGQGLAVRRDVM